MDLVYHLRELLSFYESYYHFTGVIIILRELLSFYESCYHLRELLSFTRVVIIYEGCYYLRELSIYGICCRLLELLTFYGDYRHLTGIIVILRGLLLGWKVLG